MNSEVFDVMLLLALPASGKSELRRYLAHLPEERACRELHIGPTVQLDDFPYVHFMRRVDDELAALGEERIFFHAPDKSFRDPLDWLTLVELLNEDYRNLRQGGAREVADPAEHLMRRIDVAGSKVGIADRFGRLPGRVRSALAQALQEEAAGLVAEERARSGVDLEGKTVVMEFARGASHTVTPPVPFPYGYAHSLAQLDDGILDAAVILYVWVTPEESRRKNEQRADPNDPGSILHHGVPLEVMLNDYGIDDMEYLLDTSDVPGTVVVEKMDRTFHVPTARFDNRRDLTTFLREDPASWPPDQVARVHEELSRACSSLYETWSKRRW